VNTETDFACRTGAFRSLVHELALQIAAAAPGYIREEEIPAEVIAEVSEKAAARARAEGKGEAIIPRIVAGYLKKYQDEHVLLRQAYIRDDQITIEQLVNQAIATIGENILIRRFIRWELGDSAVAAD
jgi:elongation factor Ts